MEEFLSPKQVATEYPILGSAAALAERRWRGEGPAYIKTGKGRGGRVFYRRSDIEQFLSDCTITPGRAA
ncbi:helix-turn-helix domain-containing protein [Streptomyces anulatus]|uniref:helix-turn-helix transcriptional regulator n=1 Tax=Streptomyces anulatus TaxID=1892 RepID=UPI002DDBEB3E|nr:DNA-binding protein [Streptomyces anulatus]WSC60055.1 helix-turn-helix domain-containing protein [Streptomyces anulatus]